MDYELKVKITPISPEFTPLVYIEQIDPVQKVNDIGKLKYPSVVDFDYMYGDEVERVVNADPVSILHS